jgi:hypothetical protein
MENDDDQIEVFGFEMDKDDALHASQALLIGGALVRANANNKEKQRKAEIARVEQNRQREIQKAADEKAREQQAFDAANDPCPYCHTQISKQAALCPSCRNGFFGIPWGLIKLAISRDPLLVESVTAEKLLAATASLQGEHDAMIQAEVSRLKLENERKIEESRVRAEKEQQVVKKKQEEQKVQQAKKYKIYGIAAGLFAVLQFFGLLNGGGAGSLLLGGLAAFGSYNWLKKGNSTGGKHSGHWSEKPK